MESRAWAGLEMPARRVSIGALSGTFAEPGDVIATASQAGRSIRLTMSWNLGSARRASDACRPSIRTESVYGINAGRPACRDIRGYQGDCEQQKSRGEQRDRVVWADPYEQGLRDPSEC